VSKSGGKPAQKLFWRTNRTEYSTVLDTRVEGLHAVMSWTRLGGEKRCRFRAGTGAEIFVAYGSGSDRSFDGNLCVKVGTRRCCVLAEKMPPQLASSVRCCPPAKVVQETSYRQTGTVLEMVR
jgi:hypothetical protein